MAKQKTQESISNRFFILCGNCGIASIVAGALALFIGLKYYNKFLIYTVVFWILIAIAVLALAGCVVGLIFAFKYRKNELNNPKIAGENKKREVYVVAGAIIKDGYVFAAQRGNKGETKFKWEFPGGKIEPHETPKEALVRELQEELKIKVKVHERITNIVDEYPTQILHIDTYRCELLEGTPTLTEHIDMAWSNKEELDKLVFSSADKPTLEKIKKLYL